MQLSEEEAIEKYGTHCKHSGRNMLLPYENGRTCFSCGYNVIKRKHELTKSHEKTLIILIDYKIPNTKNFVFV